MMTWRIAALLLAAGGAAMWAIALYVLWTMRRAATCTHHWTWAKDEPRTIVCRNCGTSHQP